MRLAELGERKAIEAILRRLEPMPNLPIPFGDDVSAVELGGGILAVLKTDMLVGRTDVPPGMSLQQAARKAIVMAVSDLASKGAKPIAALVSLGVPRDFTIEDIERIGDGLNAGAREYGAYVLGGDTNEACDLVIACMLFGLVDKRFFVSRSGARPGDFIAITGPFGNPPAGLKALLEGLQAPEGIRNVLLESVLMPKARLREGLALARTGALTSSIDSSDGLAWSLHELSKASNVGFVVDRLPISSESKAFAEINGLDPIELCLYGGEEYELVVTVKPERWNEAKGAVEAVGGSLIKIGKAAKGEGVYLRLNEELMPIEPRGWEHFKR